jgi:hypothetical protein
MAVFWGPCLAPVHNDAWRALLGDDDPGALDQPRLDACGAIVADVMRRGEAITVNDMPLCGHHAGVPREIYVTASLSPLRDDSGCVAGVLCACTETTAGVLAARRLKLAHQLARALSAATTDAGLCRAATTWLERCSHDLSSPWSTCAARTVASS